MTEQQVTDLMGSSKSEQEWNNNADKVKANCGGYPSCWWPAVVQSGLMRRTQPTFGASDEIKLVPLSL